MEPPHKVTRNSVAAIKILMDSPIHSITNYYSLRLTSSIRDSREQSFTISKKTVIKDKNITVNLFSLQYNC